MYIVLAIPQAFMHANPHIFIPIDCLNALLFFKWNRIKCGERDEGKERKKSSFQCSAI